MKKSEIYLMALITIESERDRWIERCKKCKSYEMRVHVYGKHASEYEEKYKEVMELYLKAQDEEREQDYK